MTYKEVAENRFNRFKENIEYWLDSDSKWGDAEIVKILTEACGYETALIDLKVISKAEARKLHEDLFKAIKEHNNKIA